MRVPDAYDRSHVPGAVRLFREEDVPQDGRPGQWLKDPDDPLHVVGPEAFAAWMSRLGIGGGTTVVTYDGFNGTFATRLWWVLRYYGHTGAKVLDGGWQRWLDEGRPVTFRETEPRSAVFTSRPDDGQRVRLKELRERYAERGVQVVNVLGLEMYAGTDDPFGNKRAGHIPGSTNLPIERILVDDDVPRLRPAAELRAAVAEAGLEPGKETPVHCQAEVRSMMAVFALSLLGWDRVRAYDASLAEWANRDDTPLEWGAA